MAAATMPMVSFFFLDRSFLDPIDHLHKHEDYPRDYQEVDQRHDEISVGKHRSFFAVSELHAHARKIDAPGEQTDDWIDKVVDQRRDNRRKGCPNDDTNCHVHDIALGYEVLEFAKHVHSPFNASAFLFA